MKKSAIAVLALFFTSVISGCMTTDPITGEKSTSNTTDGAVIGAALGGILGAVVSKEDRKKGLIIGAGIGALSGAAVGVYMDKQEDELRKKMEGTGVTVTRDGDDLILNMPGNITFNVAKSDLQNDFTKTLDGVVVVLSEYEKTLITIDGHTDSTGSEEFNQKLSEERAMSVAEYLVNEGVLAQRIAAVGYGETQPISSNDSAEGRAENRRVELRLEPLTE